jgi:hypothetical protein
LGNVSYIVAFRGSSKNTRKLHLHPILNIELFPTHIKLELDVLGVVRKIVKMEFNYGGGILKIK